MKIIFFAIILAAVVVALAVRVWFGVIDVLNDLTGQPGRVHERNSD